MLAGSRKSSCRRSEKQQLMFISIKAILGSFSAGSERWSAEIRLAEDSRCIRQRFNETWLPHTLPLRTLDLAHHCERNCQAAPLKHRAKCKKSPLTWNANSVSLSANVSWPAECFLHLLSSSYLEIYVLSKIGTYILLSHSRIDYRRGKDIPAAQAKTAMISWTLLPQVGHDYGASLL